MHATLCMLCVYIYVCVRFCVCFCVCIYTHPSTNYKYHQIFLSLSHDSIFYDMGASEVKPANLCICMTNFNQTQSFYKLPCHFRVSMLKKKKTSSDSLVFHCDKLQWFNIQPVLLRAGPHWQMNNRVQYSDSYWNICTSADPGIPFCLEGWQLLTGLINQNYADSFELDSFISPQNCTQWLERWQVTVILWVIKF